MTRRRDLTRLEEWSREPVLQGLLRDWSRVAPGKRKRQAEAWIADLRERWKEFSDLFAAAEYWTGPAGARGHTAVCFAPKGDLFAGGCADGSVRIWDLERRKLVLGFAAHAAPVTTLAFHPDGRILATGSSDHSARLWSVETGTELKRLSGHLDGVEALAFHPNGSLLGTASRDGTVALWEVPGGAHVEGLVKWPPEYVVDGKDVRIFPILSVCFAPDGRTMATGSATSVVLWDLETRKERGIWTEHRGPVTALAYTPDSRRMVSGSLDRSLRLWDVAEGRGLGALPSAVGALRYLRVLEDGETLLGLVAQGALQFWDLARRRLRTTLCPMAEDMTALDHNGREDLLCCGLETGEVRLLHLVGARKLLREAAHAFGAGGEPALAARCLELLEDWAGAAQRFAQAGDGFSAGQLFARAGDLRRAATSYRQAGALEDAARAFLKAGDLLAAAEAWMDAGLAGKAVAHLRKLLPAPPAVRIAAAWRLAACLGLAETEAATLARQAAAEFAEAVPQMPGDALLAAMRALASYAHAAAREADLKEGCEAALRAAQISAAQRVRVLEIYRSAAEAFGNAALIADLAARLDAARTVAAEEEARRRAQPPPAAKEAPMTEPAAASPSALHTLLLIWHATANQKCARLLSDLAMKFTAQISLHVGRRSAQVRRFRQLAGLLTHRSVRGFEVEFRFEGEGAKEACAVFERFLRENEVFHV